MISQTHSECVELWVNCELMSFNCIQFQTVICVDYLNDDSNFDETEKRIESLFRLSIGLKAERKEMNWNKKNPLTIHFHGNKREKSKVKGSSIRLNNKRTTKWSSNRISISRLRQTEIECWRQKKTKRRRPNEDKTTNAIYSKRKRIERRKQTNEEKIDEESESIFRLENY